MRRRRVLTNFSSRVARHKIALGLLVLAGGIFLAYIAWVSVNGVPFQDRYKLEAVIPGDAPIVKPGASVRMAGQLAGTITGVDPDGENERVTMELRPQFAPIGEDATARVRVRSIVYLTYIEIDPGNRDDPMPEGGTIPVERTGSGTDLLHVVDLFDKRTREVLRKSVDNLGVGVAGRGDELNQGLSELEPALREGIPELQALSADPQALARGISGAANVAGGLRGRRGDDVSALIGSGDAALGAVASRDLELGAGIEQLRPLEDQLLETAPLAEPVLADAGALAESLEPAARDLRTGLPRLAHLLTLGKPLRGETGRIATAADPVLQLVGPRLYDLYPVVAAIEPIIEPLQQTLDVILPYDGDITLAAEGIASATGVKYPQGQTAPNNPALRFIPVINCARARDPYPAPGQALKDSQTC
jgi:phospholipid/cholesterol/gamma-HCH transport system substrate-binding protein